MASTLSVSSMTSRAAETSDAEDRAAIENLQARYLFTMGFHDPDVVDGYGHFPCTMIHQCRARVLV